MEARKPVKTGNAWKHASREWTRDGRRGGEANIQIRIVLNLNVSFLQVKMSSFDHAKV